MALWLFDGVVYGYAWPTGKLNRLFLGPKMFDVSSDLCFQEAHGISNYTTDSYTLTGDYIIKPTHFSLQLAQAGLQDNCRVEVMSADPGNSQNTAIFELSALSMADLLTQGELIPVHRVFFTVDHDHMLVTNETELELILSGKYGKANYEGIAFYAVSAGRE